ncbi:cell death regulator Aven [Protopterus annectens]|uniref:cell death regulator Aven n=1 Tax=Protopterus annectens TaxID=7888 RepID=UPI001CFA422A|nr:cell death regulator Aven [Protopterus annectens]
MSAFFDCQALVQSLQELPLYLRLNVDAELVQVTVPTELPQFKITEKHGKKSAISHFRGQLGRTEVPAAIEKEENISSHLTHESGAGFPGTAMDITAQKSTPAHEKVDGALEEELEELLSLDAPVSSGLDKRPSKGTARDKRSKNSANVGEKVETSSGKKNSLPEPLPSRSVTKDAEEKLEDWLDSMIS